MIDDSRILLIESEQVSRAKAFAIALQSHCQQLILATSGRQGLETIASQSVELVVFNAASFRTSGVRTCMALKKSSDVPVILIQPSEKTEKNREAAHYADVVLRLPFTIRKLMNRIESFVATESINSQLRAGPFELNIESCLLQTPHGEVRLSPKLMGLMVLFIRQPNMVLSRGYLMDQVWQTAYMGDTRTLDVHIRWIREAIEQNPSRPRYLKTVRGKGYIFDATA